MRRPLSLTLCVLLWNVAAVRNVAAQDLVITNVRIIVGNGNVINQGSIVIRGGRLASVSAVAANVIVGTSTAWPALRPSASTAR